EASGVSLAARLLALVGVLLLLPYGLIAGGARRGWAALAPKLAQVRLAAVRYAASKRSVAAAQGGVHAEGGVPAHSAPVGVPADAAPVGVPAHAAPVGVPADAADPAPVGVPAFAAPAGVPADAAPVGVPADEAPVGVPAHAAPVGVPAFLASAGWMGVLLRACGRVFKGGFASVWRGFRRVGFFGLALYRRVRPARAQALEAPSAPGRLQRMRKRAGAAVGARAPGVGALLDRARGGVETLRERRAARARRPRPSLRELGETLAMMSRSEPPPAPRTSVAHSVRPAARADDVHTADVSALPVATHAVVDADAPVAAEHDLDDLLFGDSNPGCGGDDSGDESFDAGDSAGETAPGLPEELLVTLARLASDTSPGLLEAPDTLPG
ncbi:MAG: hypothetical protein KC593_12515, partial [Myxococcales bacterium]|nr:hypothetical protein [Myxococcales bacterium]